MRKKWIAIGLAISSFLITTSPYLSISADPLSDLQAQKTLPAKSFRNWKKNEKKWNEHYQNSTLIFINFLSL